MLHRLVIAALSLNFLSSCLGGNVDFFFNVNGQVVQDVARTGNGIVIGVGVDGAQSSALVEGTIPAGMALQEDGTLEGAPEETGLFQFTVETIDADGLALQRTSIVQIGEEPAP